MSRETDATKLCEACGGRRDRGSRARAPGYRGEPWTMEACAHAEGDRHRRQVILTAEAREGRFLAAGDGSWSRAQPRVSPATVLLNWASIRRVPLMVAFHNRRGALLAAGVSAFGSMLDASVVEEVLPALEREMVPDEDEDVRPAGWSRWVAVRHLRASVAAVALARERGVPWWRAIRAAAEGDDDVDVLASLPRWVVA